MHELTRPLPGLSPGLGKDVVVRFDGGAISSDGGLLMRREDQRRSGLPARLATCRDDLRPRPYPAHTGGDDRLAHADDRGR